MDGTERLSQVEEDEEEDYLDWNEVKEFMGFNRVEEEPGRLNRVEKALSDLNLQIQKMRTHRDVWISLMKSLPTVIIVTVVAFMTSAVYASADEALGEPVTIITGVTFSCVLLLWLSALVAVNWSDKKIVERQKTVTRLGNENERLRATAQEMFVKYKNSMMPTWVVQFKADSISWQDGQVRLDMVTNWRELITSSRQEDMRHLDGKLVDDMDRLVILSMTFIMDFNDFAVLAFEAARGLQFKGIQEHEEGELTQSAILAMYRYHTELNEEASKKQFLFRLLREVSRPSLSSRIKKDTIDISSLGTALASKEFRMKASIALKTHAEFDELYSRILVRIRYMYSAET
ncbi:MAG: hypothetical protein E4H14_05760 [Candidatus Thorarchaeota archaeon]|nr:MAG: hypothetical protein E4H14_05760 [Candidatus Thorarchaeota archaeon]